MAPTRRLHAIAAVVSLAVAGRSETVQSRFDPSDFQPLETIAAGDNVAFNTTSGQVSLNGGSALNGAFSNVSGRAIAVFCFSNVTLSAAATISGTNAIAILSRDGLAINTTLSISGGDASAVGPGAGVCGGFRGGQGGKYSGAPAYPASAAVNGPGYGRDPTDNWAAGGGAGYGADGGKGAPTWAGGPGGTNYGNTAVDVLWGGSGGAGGSGNNHVSHGGAGGGAIELSAIGDIEFGSSARVYADGGRGNDDYYNGGGGSGGSILLVSEGTISLETGAELSARGGHGGNATSLGRGGGGGAGGRIALFALDFISNGTVSVSGGAGGTSVGEANGNPGASGTVAFEEFYPELPRVQNIGVVEVAADSAGLVGHVTSTGMATTMVFLYWGTSDYTTNKTLWSGSTNLGLRAEGETVTNRVLGLWTNTLYYFRFYATNSYGGTWGQPSASFRTQGGPQVDNATGATVVGMTSARLNGRLTNGSSAEIRIYWGTNDGLEVKGNWCTNEFLGTRAEGSFSAAVGGLTTGRVYYYRCYASNGFGGGWADSSAVFTTLTTSIVSHDRDPVPRFERLEMTIQNSSNYANPFNPLIVDTWGEFTSPSGSETRINAFWNGTQWKLRFAGAETGLWTYTVYIEDSAGTRSQAGGFTVTNSLDHGWVRTSPRDPHYLEHCDGTQFYGVGFCKPWYVTNTMFATMRTNGCNVFTYWLATWDDKELVNLASGHDRYDMTNAAEIDLIFQAAETNDVKMIFTIWYHGMLRDSSHPWGNEEWSVNPFKNLTTCPAFFTDTNSWHYQQRLYRYIIARWGYSRALGMWHLVAEIEGTSAGANADSWHQDIFNYFDQYDPFGHPAGGSSSQSADWPGGFGVMDCPQVHNYAGAQDEVGIASNVAAVTQRLFGDYDKPDFHGEFGKPTAYGEEVRRAYQHNGAWAALASGAAITPLMWNDGGDWGEQTASMYLQLKYFRAFVDTLDVPAQDFAQAEVATSFSGGDARGLEGAQTSIVWLQDRTPGETVSGETITLSGLVEGDYLVQCYNTWSGTWHSVTTNRTSDGDLVVAVPSFQKDIAVRIAAVDLAGDRPVIENAAFSDVSAGAATLNGTLTSTGTAPTTVAVFWGPADGGTNLGAWAHTNWFGTNTAPVPVAFATNVTGLASNTLYYCRYYAVNANGSYWAPGSERFMVSEIQITATWSDAAEDGPVAGTVVVWRASAATNMELVVTYGLSGDATPGEDYSVLPTGAVTLAAGQTSAAITLVPVDDRLDEPEESVEFWLTGDQYVIGASSAAEVLIADNEEPIEFGDWNYRMAITFTNYTRPEPLTNFPALVVFTTGRVSYAQFQSAAADLRFTDTNEIETAYEIETWNTGGPSYVWVQVPLLTSNTVLFANWGRPGAAAPAYATNGATWSEGYEGVWHLKEDQSGTGAGGLYRDSTANANHGDDLVSSAGKTGVVNGGQHFDGDDYADCGNAASLEIVDRLTMEAWVNVDAADTGWTNMQVISKKSYWTNAGGYELELNTGTNWITVLGGSHNYARCEYTWETGRWHHVAASIDNTFCQIYVDGQPATMVSNVIGLLAADSTPLAIGRRPIDTEYPSWMRGYVDEARVSSVLRSQHYIWACYMNQASNDWFVTYGALAAWDSDGDAIWDGWESNCFGSVTNTDGRLDQDWDGDGFLDINEYLAGTHPTNGESNLRFEPAEYVDGERFVIRWSSESNRNYQVIYSTNLAVGFGNLVSSLPATPPENAYTDSIPAEVDIRLYRVRVRDEDL